MTEKQTRLVCVTCGQIPQDESDARRTWVLGIENGRQVWTCDRCGRENLRSIEGKLDSAWW